MNIALVNTMQLKKKVLNANVPTTSEEVVKPSLSDKLRSWSIDFYIRRRAINALLKILRFFGMQSLPADSRSLLKTPRTIKIDALSGGQYWHNGLKKVLLRIFCKLPFNLRTGINVSMDGLPLYKSFSKSFWPILVNFPGMYT